MIAAVGDFSHPTWRASALGVYRMWRDSGFALGAFIIGLLMDPFTVTLSFYLTAILMIASGALVARAVRYFIVVRGTYDEIKH